MAVPTPTALSTFTAGTLSEWMSALRSVTSPLKSCSKFCGFQRFWFSASSKTSGESTMIVDGV